MVQSCIRIMANAREGRYKPVDSTFHETAKLWLPDRLMAVLAFSVKISVVMVQLALSASETATSLNDSLRLPATPLPPDQTGAFHETSAGAHVGVPDSECVNVPASALMYNFNCFVAVANTIFSTLTACTAVTVLVVISVT